MLGGGAGIYASLGEMGPKVQAGVGRHLGFGSMIVRRGCTTVRSRIRTTLGVEALVGHNFRTKAPPSVK